VPKCRPVGYTSRRCGSFLERRRGQIEEIRLVAEPSFWQTEYGNVASVVGVLLTIGGFIVTWRKQKRLRDATVAAQREARQIIQNFSERLAVADFTMVSTLAQDLRHQIRGRSWERAADRAERLRNLLGHMVLSRHLSPEEKAFLGESADDTNLVLRAVERLYGQPDGQVSGQMVSKLDAVIMRLNAIDGRLRNEQLGGGEHG
jgi:hypothetical protein